MARGSAHPTLSESPLGGQRVNMSVTASVRVDLANQSGPPQAMAAYILYVPTTGHYGEKPRY